MRSRSWTALGCIRHARRPVLASLAFAAIAFLPAPSRASYAIFVGSYLTADGTDSYTGTIEATA